MDKIFRDLEKAGKTDVESLIKWLENSKVIETAKEDTSRVRALFRDAVNQKHVELQKFKEVIEQLAKEQSKNVEQLSKQLAAEGPRFIEAAIIGLEAFKKALKDKK